VQGRASGLGVERANGTCSQRVLPRPNSVLFSFKSHLSVYTQLPQTMSDGFDYDYDDYDQDDNHSESPGLLPPESLLDDEDEFGVGIQPMPRRLQRSRPPMDFSARRSAVGTDFGYPASTFTCPHSRMSGSTLHSTLNPLTAPSFPHKIPPPPLTPRLTLEAIMSLTVPELSHNPHYRELRKKYDHVTGVLATFVERNLAESRTAKSDTNTLVPDIYQGMYYFIYPGNC
jgi:hypothetical protein